jgi:diadenosine tetraphosphate (Ap4A) HIT family hydrolase
MMRQDPNCIFCQIVTDTRKCTLLAEDPAATTNALAMSALTGWCDRE